MTNRIRSESPDEFLKNAGLTGYDPTLTPKETTPTIDKLKIKSLNQPKDGTESKDCKDCE
jgi:hypothetical protein